MYQVVIVIHILLGLSVIGLVLMQHGKGADAGAAFGSGASGTVFGAQGAASFLSRTTAIMAALFFLTSLGLAILSGQAADENQDIFTEDAATLEVPVDMPVLQQIQPLTEEETSEAPALEPEADAAGGTNN
ncbi:MAG: preprotein translocase subunit SecG [Methylococcales bacterium]|nr:preprotein translocase subunit SecG [Methylococcales bacterium]